MIISPEIGNVAKPCSKPIKKVVQICYFYKMKLSKITQFPAKALTVVCLFLMATAFVIPVHRFYLSLTEVRVDSKKQTLDVSCKLFTDDLENALFKKYGKKIDLASSTKNKDVQSLLHKYINENFRINVGGRLLTLTFVGFETETDATWCYLESVPFTSKGKVSILNTLLYDYLPEQSNMVNFYWDDAEKSAKLVNPEKTVDFVF
jgi:RNA recognition motif-containing protein